MGLHLFIDGYNLIRTSDRFSRAEAVSLEQGRRALLERLAEYKKLKASPITVVFDAAAGVHLSESKEQVRGIEVVYSPAGQSADQVIVHLVRRKGSQALVVTSDRALAEAVEEAGATAIDSPRFEERMETAFYLGAGGPDAEEGEDRVPTLSTRKKGPSKRRPRAARRRAARLEKI